MFTIIKLLAEMTAYLFLAVIAAALIGALVAGLGQAVALETASCNAAGWGACLASFALLALTGRPIATQRLS